MSRRYLPPLNALRAFEAAARHGSFTKAANELCVTPGAVSRQVQVLEEHLGTALFTRMNREVVLSPQGQRYREALSAAFDQINASTTSLKSGRELHISTYLTFGMRWLVPRLPAFMQQNPKYPITFTTTPPNINDVSSGTIEVAILMGKGDWPGVDIHPLFPVVTEPVVSPDLLARIPLKTPDDLAKVPLLHSSARPDDWADWIASVPNLSIPQCGSAMFESSSLAFEAAVHGMGAAIGQRALIVRELDSGKLIAPFQHRHSDGTQFYLTYSRKLAGDERIKRFRKWILAEAASFNERHGDGD
ncbi:MAG: transcriptional regulator GcvA [Hyphomicrobiaceae bacterium]|nr:transcriptional regulator GcvA [Hyphomicrobiaceae bacterium]